ncbi:hypothetical protein ACEWY4_021320 [Coilia grayii]|uniref:Reverse transcriptase/retrotransposon-derived protein RNase H-like domain-containing protein n=1 Tax=Coilia grayii TaxID=363190 RepID=A0ABD1J8U4_9TELE
MNSKVQAEEPMEIATQRGTSSLVPSVADPISLIFCLLHRSVSDGETPFSKAGTLATSLCRSFPNKPERLLWNIPATQAFLQLKMGLTTAQVLRHPDPDLPFTVEVDASTTGVGAVLFQPHGEPLCLHPYAYFSKKFH